MANKDTIRGKEKTTSSLIENLQVGDRHFAPLYTATLISPLAHHMSGIEGAGVLHLNDLISTQTELASFKRDVVVESPRPSLTTTTTTTTSNRSSRSIGM